MRFRLFLALYLKLCTDAGRFLLFVQVEEWFGDAIMKCQAAQVLQGFNI